MRNLDGGYKGKWGVVNKTWTDAVERSVGIL
jgi:hypothetical protein